MKKGFLLATCSLLFAVSAMAQNFGFGGWQAPKVELQTSAEFKDINYLGDGQVYHNLDVYLPKSDQKKFPVVIHIYGSAWFMNSGKGMADLGTIVDALLKAGYAVVCPNHRSSGDAKFPAQKEDIQNVIRWVRANAKQYKFDTSFIATSGFSSGGHLATLAGTTGEGDTKVNAVCDWSGPIDMFRMNCDEPRKWGNTPEEALVGEPYSDAIADKYRAVSPITYLDKNDAPVCIFHGTEDNVVPCCQGQELYDECRKVGVYAELTLVPGGGHGMNMYSKENLDKMVNFLNAQKKKK